MLYEKRMNDSTAKKKLVNYLISYFVTQLSTD